MGLARQRPGTNAFAMDVLCARILERHRDSIKVRKSHLAVPNLTRIIGATLALSNKHGFHATTLRQLAEASGLSMGGLYTYFDSKPTLLSMILGEVAETAAEVLTAPPDDVKHDARRHLHWIIATHVRMSEAMQPWFVFAFLGMAALGNMGFVPVALFKPAADLATFLLATALAAMGFGMNLGTLRAKGVKPLLLALSSWVLISLVSLVLIKLAV